MFNGEISRGKRIQVTGDCELISGGHEGLDKHLMVKELNLSDNLNQRVVELVNSWRREGSIQQEGFDWTSSKQNWVNTFPKDKKFISGLPSEIGRGEVRAICESSKFSIREKFLAVMVWGYGDRGYGPYRVTQMLSQEHAEDVLSEVFDICQKGNPKIAYDFLRKNRIRILGPSYSSKFITFCTPRNIGAPIYDSYIALWIDTFAADDFVGVRTSSEVWNSKTYAHYWDWIKEHAEELDCFPDDIELVLFRDAESRFTKASNWSGK